MKTLFKILASCIVGLVLIGGVLYFMGSEKVDVTESVTIMKSQEELYKTVGDFNTWSKWSPWAEKDPSMKTEFTGTPLTVGHKNSWTGNDEVGEGMQQIKSLQVNKELVMDLEFFKPAPSKSIVVWNFEPVEGGTKVTWHTEGPISGMGRVFDALMDFNSGISVDFKKGLDNLSKL